MDIGSVLGEIGILPEYREVTGTPRGFIGPTWASREKREGRGTREEGKEGRPLPNSDWAWGGSLAPFPSFPLKPNEAHIPPGGFR